MLYYRDFVHAETMVEKTFQLETSLESYTATVLLDGEVVHSIRMNSKAKRPEMGAKGLAVMHIRDKLGFLPLEEKEGGSKRDWRTTPKRKTRRKKPDHHDLFPPDPNSARQENRLCPACRQELLNLIKKFIDRI